MKKTALIMAGGRGERFWPKSRKNLPKQFLSLTGNGKTMIQLTVERVLPLVAMEDIYIATNQDYRPLVMEQLPELPKENILCEPVGRNTAPCIGLGAVHIASKYEDAAMIVLPSDHLIKSNDLFIDTLKEACDMADSGKNLITIGITPDYPETGYGYIKFIPDSLTGKAYNVDCFVEKPNMELAKEYVASGKYLWNSGMFVWKVSTVLENIQEFMPKTFEGLMTIKNSIKTENEEQTLLTVFPSLESLSIDYGVMEKAANIYTIPGSFGWDDVGSWLAVERIQTNDSYGNALAGNIVPIATKNCIIQGSEKLIATVGIENLVIVDTPDATLITTKESTGDIKQILEELRKQNRTEYL